MFSFLPTPGCSTAQFAPSYYHVLPKQPPPPADDQITDMTPQRDPVGAGGVTPNTSVFTVTTPKNSGETTSLDSKSE